MSTAESPRRAIKVRYDGRCTECAIVLPKGAAAIFDRGTRQLYCLACQGPSANAEPTQPDIGLAGASARREYERRKANDEARIRARFGRLGGLAVALSDERQSTRAWRIGADGEAKLPASLAGYWDFRLLHDRRVAGTKGNIDHLIVSPAGVFVVDAKNYRGMIRIRDKGWLLRPDPRLYVGSRDCSKLADGLQWQVEAVQSVLPTIGVTPRPSVTPVLCFVDGDWPLLFPPSEYRGVRLETPKTLRKLVSAPPVLEMAAVDRLVHALGTVFPAK